eukprot:4527231-Alexandrium_andersonii.AAC.1
MLLPLQARIAAGTISDVLAQPALTGLASPEPTCAAHSASKRTRRDYVFVSAGLSRFLQSAWTDVAAGFDAHAALFAKLCFPSDMSCNVLNPPAPIPEWMHQDPRAAREAISRQADPLFAQVDHVLEGALADGDTT